MATVTVGCKLPSGLIINMEGREVTLKGANSSLVIGGFGLTEGVDKAFFDTWLARNQDFPAVENGLIFVQSTTKNAEAEATEKQALRSGFEGLNPDAPAPNITPTDEMKKELAKVS